MMYWNNGWGWVGWLTMMIFMVSFWGLIAWAVIAVVRGLSGTRHQQRSAEDILAERFARGEIDHDEYTQRLDTLRSTR
ncbi:MAG: SHOCT domain-containing protein [Acidimicrobiales bacterium]